MPFLLAPQYLRLLGSGILSALGVHAGNSLQESPQEIVKEGGKKDKKKKGQAGGGEEEDLDALLAEFGVNAEAAAGLQITVIFASY